MSRRPRPVFPSTSFGLLLVEGGDERSVCQAVTDPSTWSGLVCWPADGRDDLVNLARAALNAPNSAHIRSVGVVLDAEEDIPAALGLAARTLAVFENTPVATSRRTSFLMPDGVSPGAIETLCRRAVRNVALAACVDQLVNCAGSPHSLHARADKGWLRAYLGMTADPNLRPDQAFTAPDGIDSTHAAFDPLRAFLLAL
jgi:hypothetical protein